MLADNYEELIQSITEALIELKKERVLATEMRDRVQGNEDLSDSARAEIKIIAERDAPILIEAAVHQEVIEGIRKATVKLKRNFNNDGSASNFSEDKLGGLVIIDVDIIRTEKENARLL